MVALSGSGWRLAPSLVAMFHEANRIAPNRRRASDGSIGDPAHRARVSDHNPSGGFVHALDLTHDPARGFDAHRHADRLLTSRDPRIKYLISNARIGGPGSRYGWRWGPYTGANLHRTHLHVSVQATQLGRHGTSPWFSGAPVAPSAPPPPAPEPEPESEEDDVALMVQLNHPGHPHHGRVEAVTAMHRRWIPTQEEINLHRFLGGGFLRCTRAEFNRWTSNKEPIGGGLRGPI